VAVRDSRGAHVIARAATPGGALPWKGTIVDDRPGEATDDR